MSAIRYKRGSIIALNIAQLGWAGKAFEVIDWSLSNDLGIDLILKEYAGEFYDWDKTESSALEFAGATDLPDPRTLIAPADLQAFAGEAQAKNQDGSVTGSVLLEWLNSDDRTDHFIVEKQAADGLWEWAAAPRDSAAEIGGLIGGQTYLFRVRGVSGIGVLSDWAAALSHLVSLPIVTLATPTNLAFSIDPNSPVTVISGARRLQPVTITWDALTDTDCVGYEVTRRFPNEAIFVPVAQPFVRTESTATVDFVQGQANIVRVRVLSVFGQAGTGNWFNLTVTPPVTNDQLATVGAFYQSPFPVRG